MKINDLGLKVLYQINLNSEINPAETDLDNLNNQYIDEFMLIARCDDKMCCVDGYCDNNPGCDCWGWEDLG